MKTPLDQARQGHRLESKLAAYERMYSIEPRRLQGDREYEAAAGQRASFIIQKLASRHCNKIPGPLWATVAA